MVSSSNLLSVCVSFCIGVCVFCLLRLLPSGGEVVVGLMAEHFTSIFQLDLGSLVVLI